MAPRGRAVRRGPALWTRTFVTYWSATSVSNLGSGVSLVALPVLAAQELGADAAAVGGLRAAEAAPYLVLSLVVGHLADRLRPLHLMVAADVARALLLGVVVVLAARSELSLLLLYPVLFAIGTMTVAYDIAQFTLLPAVLDERRLVAGNAAVELARGAASTFGPGLGGLLVGVLRAGPALVVDALTYGYSAVALATLRRTPSPPRSTADGARDPLRRSLARGVRFVRQHPTLLPMTAYLGVNNVCNQAFLTGLTAYLVVGRRTSPALVGLAFGAYGAGFLLAAPLAPLLGRRWGGGASVTTSSVLSAAGIALVAVSTLDPSRPRAEAAVLAGCSVVEFAAPLFNVPSVALRLAVTPRPLLGRVNAVVKLVSQSAIPLGALAGGALFQPVPARGVVRGHRRRELPRHGRPRVLPGRPGAGPDRRPGVTARAVVHRPPLRAPEVPPGAATRAGRRFASVRPPAPNGRTR